MTGRVGAWLVAGSSVFLLASQAQAARHDLSVRGQAQEVVTADLDGDTHLDLMVTSVEGQRAGSRRLVSIFWGRGDLDRLSRRPDLVWTVPEDVVMLDCSQDSDGDRLWAVTESGVRRVDFGPTGDVVETPVVDRATGLVAAHRSVAWHDLAVAVSTDGPELLVPGPDGLDLITIGERRALRLPIRPESFVWHGPWNDPTLRAYSFHRPIAVADQDGDGMAEVLGFRRDVISVFDVEYSAAGARRASRRTFPVELLTDDEAASREYTVRVRFEDLRGSGRHDLLAFVWRDEGLLEFSGRVMVFAAREDGSFPTVATERLELDDPVFDYAEVVDLDRDGSVEVLVPSARLGAFAFIRFVTTRVATFGFHLLDTDSGGTFRRVATDRRELSARFSEDFDRAVFTFPDADGDGTRDLVFGRGIDKFCLYRGLRPARGGWSFETKPNQCLDDDPFARYTTVDLDGDGADELVGVGFDRGRSSRVSIFDLVSGESRR